MITMTLQEQIDTIQDNVRQALITALEQKDDTKARKLFAILADVRAVIPPFYKEPSTFSISSSPDIISFGGTDAGIVSDRH
jgi:hypothetical protein